jgi:ATP synthase protein I
MKDSERLKGKVEQGVARLRKAERERGTLMSYSLYLGTLGMLLAAPVVGGAYLGVWLDQSLGTYVFTLLFILAGVAFGAVNVYLYLRK